MGSVLENGLYLPDEGERNAYNGLKGNWNTLDNLVETVTALSSTGLIRKPVDALPITDIQTNVIYMLKATKPNGDVYRIEYMYIDDHWDPLGTSETTLDDYYTKTETDDLPAVKSGINATKVSNYDTHLANNDIHVSLANKQTWDGKQNALDTAQTAAVNSGVTGTKVTGYDTHVSDTDIHVTAADKTAWNSKQDGLSQTQLTAVNSGITGTKVTGYDSHVADTDVHVTTADKAAWNGKQDALTQTQLNNIATIPDKANSADLATVATSGSYTDLINAPTIPTVNNATLTIQKNGTDVATFTANASSNVTANLSIPVNTSDLNNDAGFLTQHNPIDNELSATSENALQNKVINTELNGKAPLVHTHAASDITSGTFNIARIPNLDASKITSGTIDIARLPKGSLERLIKVADQTARYALTADDVQLGDTVQQLDTGVMYVVTDETKLDSADGYTEFTAGSASSVPWTGVTGKPSSFTPSSHTHGNVTNDGKVGTTANQPLITGTGGAVQAGSFGTSANTFCEGNDSRLSDARTPVAHTHGKADITDLFNSANTWSGDNTYSASINYKSSYTLGNLPASAIAQSAFKILDSTGTDFICDINSFQNALATGLRFTTRNKMDANGFSPSGTIKANYLHFLQNAENKGYLQWDGYTKNNVIPLTTNTYDLGTSSYQWNNLYAKNYYYNGTEFQSKFVTTDTAQTVNGIKTFTAYVGSIGSSTGDEYSSNTRTNLWLMGNRDTQGVSGILFDTYRQNTAQGTGMHILGISIKENSVRYEGCRWGWYWDNNLNGYTFDFKPTTQGANQALKHNLGTSTDKWDTLNGINPGALSLPDVFDSYDVVTTNWSTAYNQPNDLKINGADPSYPGWLFIRLDNCTAADDFVIVRYFHVNATNLTFFGSFIPTASSYVLSVPIQAGITTKVWVSKIPTTCKYYACLGTVK